MNRRAFVSVTAAALTAGPIAPRHVDPALIDYFEQQLEGHYRADMLLGPHDLIGTVSAQYELICSPPNAGLLMTLRCSVLPFAPCALYSTR